MDEKHNQFYFCKSWKCEQSANVFVCRPTVIILDAAGNAEPLSLSMSTICPSSATQTLTGAASDHLGHTPLIEAAMTGLLKEVQDLLSAKSNPDLQDDMGMTALMWTACSVNYPASWVQDHAAVTVLLLEGNASVNLEDDNGATALMHALSHGSDTTTQDHDRPTGCVKMMGTGVLSTLRALLDGRRGLGQLKQALDNKQRGCKLVVA